MNPQGEEINASSNRISNEPFAPRGLILSPSQTDVSTGSRLTGNLTSQPPHCFGFPPSGASRPAARINTFPKLFPPCTVSETGASSFVGSTRSTTPS
jgi:hypothetical protein